MIELLVVIVVLSIITLIATPIVMKTIKNAKKGSIERSAYTYIKQVEVEVAVATAGGDTSWNDNNWTGAKLPTWLYDNLNSTTHSVLKVYGYWVSSGVKSYFYRSWGGYLNDCNINDINYYGIRPVITIPKSQIN